MNNRSLKIEKSIPDPITENDLEYQHPFEFEGDSSIRPISSHNGASFQLEQ